jgi:hypothetical protein
MPSIDPAVRKQALDSNTSPTGRTFGVQNWQSNPALFEIVYTDNKPGELPRDFQGSKFTKSALARAHIQKVLNALWDEAEDKTHTKRANAA